MPRKGHFTPEQHEQMGAQLIKMHHDLTKMVVAIGPVYGVTAKSIKHIDKMIKALTELRSELDSRAFEDCRDRPASEVQKYYYGPVRALEDSADS